ncbi:hypothetical protein Cma02nite_09230 [Cellulomonas marina]|nr:hypothetical protein Cma02nite_09230 [Cellulomonas marina]
MTPISAVPAPAPVPLAVAAAVSAAVPVPDAACVPVCVLMPVLPLRWSLVGPRRCGRAPDGREPVLPDGPILPLDEGRAGGRPPDGRRGPDRWRSGPRRATSPAVRGRVRRG